MEATAYFDSPIGPLLLTAGPEGLTTVRVQNEYGPADPSPLLREACRQLEQYFAGARHDFDLPLAPRGTAFQLRVWQALRNIPYGQTRSYGQLAKALGSPKAARAVGGAAHRNPLLILIPCHRLIGAGGELTGFACGIESKRYLLRLENAAFKEHPAITRK